jgi:hypothetical protein
VTRWDAARARSQQPQRKYKPVGPVGTPLASGALDATCPACRYHVCSCTPEAEALRHWRFNPPWAARAGRTFQFPIAGADDGRTHDPGHPAFSLNPATPRTFAPSALFTPGPFHDYVLGAVLKTLDADRETHLEQHKRLLLEGVWDDTPSKPLPIESAGERKRPLP